MENITEQILVSANQPVKDDNLDIIILHNLTLFHYFVVDD